MTECKNCIKKDVCDRDVGHGYSVCPHYLSADFVEVVRCKDCKYFSEFQHCGILGFCEPNEYCSRGERRKEDVDARL